MYVLKKNNYVLIKKHIQFWRNKLLNFKVGHNKTHQNTKNRKNVFLIKLLIHFLKVLLSFV